MVDVGSAIFYLLAELRNVSYHSAVSGEIKNGENVRLVRLLGRAIDRRRTEATGMLEFAVDLHHVGWHQFLYHAMLLSTEQMARSGEKYLWSSLQHNEERELPSKVVERSTEP